MFGIGLGDRDADLFRGIEVDIEVGADQFHQFNILEVDHVGSVTALNQGPLQLLLKPFHCISKHDLLHLPLFQGMHGNIVICGLHKKDVGRLDGKTKLLGLIPEGDHLLLPELLRGILRQVLQLCTFIFQGEVEP